MAKRLTVLIAMLALLLAAALPALAQEEATPDEASGSPPGPSTDETATLTFELTVSGTPPEGTTFLGFIPAEGGISVPLTDPDGDGVYTGSTTLDRFGPGPRPVPPGTEPVSLPVQIVQESGGNIEVIRDFGVVPLDRDRTFRARVVFRGDRGGTAQPATPETGVDVNEDGLINETDGEVAAAVSDAAMQAAKSSSERTLPATGGVALPYLFAGLAGLFLAAGGLLNRHVIR